MRKGAKTKQEIIRISQQLFYQKGYDTTTVQDILDALDISKGSFYHHFGAKIDVLAEIAWIQAQKSKLAYEETSNHSIQVKLNRLLLHASPLRKAEAELLMSLARMKISSERSILWDAMTDAATKCFYQPFSELLKSFKEQQLAFWRNEESLKLAFASYQSGLKPFVDLCRQKASQQSAQQAISLLQALRIQTERQLGLQAGSVVILNIEALLELMNFVWAASAAAKHP